jgi:hypothetical protein
MVSGRLLTDKGRRAFGGSLRPEAHEDGVEPDDS